MTASEFDPEAASITVSCRVGGSMPVEETAGYLEELRDCEAAGRIEGFKLHRWPREVVVSGDGAERAMIRGYGSYREWADRAGVSLEPAFTTRTRTSIVTDDEIEVLVLPSTCLALYDDEGYLVGVYPHADAEGIYTVADALARVRVGTVPVPRSGGPVRVAGEEPCPECQGLPVYWRGVYLCPDCRWIGSVAADGSYQQVAVRQSGGADAVTVAPGAPVGRRGD